MAGEKKHVRSEDALGHMWDRCIADTVVKTGAGVIIGALTSLLLFKRRPWPVIFGVGMGFGHGVANCKNDYKTIAAPAFSSKLSDSSTQTELPQDTS